MRKQLALTACLIGLALPASEAGAATFLYDVYFSRPVDYPGFIGATPDFVQGTITTDCNDCVMVQSDIVDWNLTIAVPGSPSSVLLGPLSGNNSAIEVFSGSNNMVATSKGLFFNFSTPGAELFFRDASLIDSLLLLGISPSFNFPSTISWSIQSTDVFINPTSDQIGTAVNGVPEPSTWAMMLLGFAGLGFAFRQSRRKVSFA